MDGLFDGDTAAVGGWSARFAGFVYPGETLIVSAWKRDDRFLVQAEVAGRGVVALSNGVLRLR